MFLHHFFKTKNNYVKLELSDGPNPNVHIQDPCIKDLRRKSVTILMDYIGGNGSQIITVALLHVSENANEIQTAIRTMNPGEQAQFNNYMIKVLSVQYVNNFVHKN